MRTKKNLFAALLLLALFSMLLGACAAPTAVVEEPTEEVVEEPTEEATEEATEEPTAEPTEEATPEPTADLDSAFSAFLAGMEAYNTTTPQAVSEALVENPPFLLDVREVSEIEENGYIEGAINIPLRELGKNLDKLPSFDTPIVAYCGSGWRCTIAMTALGALGWTDVKSMVGGSFGGWVQAGFPVVEGVPPAAEVLNAASPDPLLVAAIDAALSGIPEGWGAIEPADLNTRLAEGEELILIDVRRADEVEAQGYIEGALQIPIEQFIEMKDMWPAIDANIVTYCGVGVRGNIAATILRTYGYQNVLNLKGGFNAWKDAGFAFEGGPDLDGAFAAFLAGMEAYNTIQPADVNTLLAEGNELFLLDVREVSEIEENGYIEGAINIPLRSLGKNLDKLPSFDTPIVAYCGSGWRCTIAMTALGALGWTDVKSMVGGSFGGWVQAGFPVVEGVPAEPAVLNAATPDPALVAAIDAALSGIPEGWGAIEPADLNTRLAEGEELILIDVRRADEIAENGYIEGALQIPIEQFIEMKDMWPAKDASIVTYCGVGVRGNIAATILRTYGYKNVLNLKGGFNAWVAGGFPVVTD